MVVGGLTAIDQPVLSHDGRYVGFRKSNRNPAAFVFSLPPMSLFRIDRLGGERIEVFDGTDNTLTAASPRNVAISGEGGAIVFTSAEPIVAPDLNDLADVFLARLDDSSGALLSAVLPSSRSTTLNSPTTVFTTLIATEALTSCNLQLANDEPIDFSFQRVDIATGVVEGGINETFDLAANTPVNLILRLEASTPVSSQELVFDSWCATGQASNSTVGLNTLRFSAAASAPADIVALPASTENDGTMTVPPDGSFGFFSMATTNVGATDTIRVEPLVSGIDAASALVCETDTTTGACLADPVPALTLEIVSGETSTFGVFVRSTQEAIFDPTHNRVRVEFSDAAGVNRGRTSLALR